jgi:hypothetical protein
VGRSCSEISWQHAARALCALLLVGRSVAAAGKVDVVHLKNGDRLTCEIKKLERSLLTTSTDPFGSVSVHWGEVTNLVSPRAFDIQIASGRHYYGTLVMAPPGQLGVATGGGSPTTLPLTEVIRLAPVGASIWSRMDGSLDVGFSFAQANRETHVTLNSTASYRSRLYLLATTVASQITAREDADRLSRNSLGLSGNRSFGNQWYTTVWGQVQQNEELSLDLRMVAGGGLGRDLVHTDHRLWSAYVGMAYTNERFSEEPTDQSAEAAVGGRLDFFTPGHEDFRITNSVVSYFNVSGRARARLELQSAWRHEFLKDFYWSLNGFESLDSDPPAEQKKNDFAITFAIGWKF